MFYLDSQFERCRFTFKMITRANLMFLGATRNFYHTFSTHTRTQTHTHMPIAIVAADDGVVPPLPYSFDGFRLEIQIRRNSSQTARCVLCESYVVCEIVVNLNICM